MKQVWGVREEDYFLWKNNQTNQTTYFLLNSYDGKRSMLLSAAALMFVPLYTRGSTLQMRFQQRQSGLLFGPVCHLRN